MLFFLLNMVVNQKHLNSKQIKYFSITKKQSNEYTCAI